MRRALMLICTSQFWAVLTLSAAVLLFTLPSSILAADTPSTKAIAFRKPAETWIRVACVARRYDHRQLAAGQQLRAKNKANRIVGTFLPR